MVGVAGKSQACNTCRFRRVKCDFGRPSCQKCTASNRACAGYGRDVVFINRTPSNPKSTALSVLSERRAQALKKTKLRKTLSDTSAEVELQRLFFESSQGSELFRNYAVEMLKATYLPHQSSSPQLQLEMSGGGGFAWIYRLANLTEPSRSLDTSIFAFCLCQLYLTDKGNTSLDRCLDQYNVALQHLCSDLEDPDVRTREVTVATILVLSTCELFVCPAEGGWAVHARGITEILKLRDPSTADTPTWHQLFSRLRVICTLEALSKRQSRFLHDGIWRQMADESSSNNAVDQIFGMFVDVPILLERAGLLRSISDHDTLLKHATTVTRSLVFKIQRLDSWLAAFCETLPNSGFWTIESRATNPVDAENTGKTFPTCFEFESINVAVPIVMCWSVVAQLYSNIIQIHDLVLSQSSNYTGLEALLASIEDVPAGYKNDNTILLAPLSWTTLSSSTIRDGNGGSLIQEMHNRGTTAARQICQSMEYYHRIENGTYGGQATTYPTWSARQYFKLHPGHERERAWLMNMRKMEGPGTRWGLSMMTFEDIEEPLAGWHASGLG